MYSAVDTIPAFVAWWSKASREPADVQLDTWASQYLAAWPALRDLQLAEYGREGLDWRQAAREHVLPVLATQLAQILAAHVFVRTCAPTILARARELLDFCDPLILVYHVGIGQGAGWATRLGGTPAVLFGLENIAACGWASARAINGLAAHEYAHAWQAALRTRHHLAPAAEPWQTLYEEGMATFIENQVLGRASWHMQNGQASWLTWCQAQRAGLAGEFLRRLNAGASVTAFFGSWYNLEGYTQTGYYLGHELAAGWCEHANLQEIALWPPDEIMERTRQGLHAFANT